MRVIINRRAVYLIFETDERHIESSADELAQLAAGIELDKKLFAPIGKAFLEIERKMKVKQDDASPADAEREPE